MTFTERILAFLDARELEPCQIADDAGTHTCNQQATVYRLDYEMPMCGRCSDERP